MSVNMFSMGMCPTSCGEPPTVPGPIPPRKRRRRRRKRSRISAFVGVEERVTKLEQELKQVKLQVACQERRIAELEARTVRTKGKDRAAEILAQSPPPSMDEASSACQDATRRNAIGPASGNNGPEPSAPDQGNQAHVPRPDQVGRRHKPRRRRRKSRSAQESGPACSDPRSLPTDQTGDKSGRSIPGPECTLLAIQESSASVPSAADDQGLATDASVGTAARARKYAVLYAQKTLRNRTPQVAGVDPMALLQFAIVIKMWKTRLIPVLIWILQHLKN
jgi:hypothetical protein